MGWSTVKAPAPARRGGILRAEGDHPGTIWAWRCVLCSGAPCVAVRCVVHCVSRSNLRQQNAAHDSGIPLPAGSGRQTFRVKLRSDLVVGQTLLAQMLHARQSVAFPIPIAERFPTLTGTLLLTDTITRHAKLEHGLRLVVLGDRTHELPHKDARRIFRHQIGLCRRQQRKSTLVEIRDNGLLDHQVSCKPVEPLNHNRSHAVSEQRSHQLTPGWAIHALDGTADTRFTKDADDPETVPSGVIEDRFALAGKTVPIQLPSSRDSNVSEGFCHASTMRAFGPSVNSYSGELGKSNKTVIRAAH